MKINNKPILKYSKDLTVLYVEDNLKVLQSTKKMLSNFFHHIDTAVDGIEGLEKYNSYYKENSCYYDIVFSDIDMPKMNGIEMCQEIIKINNEQSIIFNTAFNEIDNLHNALKIGAKGFLTKPLNLEYLKKIIYQTSQAIHDRKLISRYCDELEDNNLRLNNKIKVHKSYEHIIDCVGDIELNKNILIEKWVNCDSTSEKLRQHIIDKEYFKNRYAVNVLEYFIGVINGTNQAGNCPVIITMLEFLKHKNLPLESVFVICVNFKNTMTSYIFEKYEFNQNLFDELSFILDKNFEGVIINYMKMKYKTSNIKPIEENAAASKKENKDAEYINNINYKDYVFEHDIYEFQELETEIDNIAIAVTMNNQSTIENFSILGSKIAKYGSLLITYPIFKDLGSYIFKLGNSFSENAQLLQDDSEKVSNISILLEGFVNDLIVWRKEIFENNISDHNFLNASFSSNIDTIIQYIEYDEENDISSDDDIEFF